MFKKGHVPDKVGPTPPHRQPFENFVNKVVEEYTFRGDETWVVEKPLWQMSPDDVREIDADITFVPHKEHHNFPCGDKKVLREGNLRKLIESSVLYIIVVHLFTNFLY